MTAQEYLKALSNRLRALPRAERKRVCDEIRRAIESDVSSGMSEAAAVAARGDIDALADKTLADAEARGVRIRRKARPIAIVLTALAGLILAGAAAVALLVHVFGYSVGPEPAWTDLVKDIELAPGTSLFAELDSFRLIMDVSDDSLAHIIYSENANCSFSIEEAEDGLHIRQTEKKHITSLFRRHIRLAYVLLPASFSGSVTVRATAGEVSIEDLPNLRALDVFVNEGDLRIRNVSAFSAQLSYTAGGLELDGLDAESFVKLNGVTGVSHVKNVNTPLFEVNITAGSMELSAVDAEVSRIMATTGSYSISDYDSQDITINLTTGSVNGMLKGRLNDYEIDCGTLTGNCNLPSENNGGPRKLFGRCTTGRIHIYFENEERGQETPVPDWYF